MTIRVMALLRSLLSGWRTIGQLAEESGAHPRTVYRYIAAMQSAQLPLEIDRHDWNQPARYRLR